MDGELGGPLDRGMMRVGERSGWDDRQPTTAHAQQDGGARRVATRGKPAHVVGSAILTLQHQKGGLSRASTLVAPDRMTTVLFEFSPVHCPKHRTCQTLRMLRANCYALMKARRGRDTPRDTEWLACSRRRSKRAPEVRSVRARRPGQSQTAATMHGAVTIPSTRPVAINDMPSARLQNHARLRCDP